MAEATNSLDSNWRTVVVGMKLLEGNYFKKGFRNDRQLFDKRQGTYKNEKTPLRIF
jgi:hypothetical protein